jgi:hypothetical protein
VVNAISTVHTDARDRPATAVVLERVQIDEG